MKRNKVGSGSFIQRIWFHLPRSIAPDVEGCELDTGVSFCNPLKLGQFWFPVHIAVQQDQLLMERVKLPRKWPKKLFLFLYATLQPNRSSFDTFSESWSERKLTIMGHLLWSRRMRPQHRFRSSGSGLEVARPFFILLHHSVTCRGGWQFWNSQKRRYQLSLVFSQLRANCRIAWPHWRATGSTCTSFL